MGGKPRRDLLIVAAFVAAVFLPFMGKAYHNDEPFFLAAARQVLARPLHPLAFTFTWYGRDLPAAQINTTPPLLFYVLAAAVRLGGDCEFLTRFVLFPLDLAAALALYLLAARFLSKPLLPTLIVIATPAYLINMNHLMPEKLAGALGFCGLYALVRGVDDERPRWYWGSAALLGAAIVSKYNAAAFLAPAAVYAWKRKIPPRRIGVYLAGAAAPAALLIVFYALHDPDLIARAWSVTTGSQVSWWSTWPHKLRSFLAFVGGCGVVTAVWPFLGAARRPAWAALATVFLLFLPALDLAVTVRLVDRVSGFLMAGGGLLGLAAAFAPPARRRRGWPLWAGWLAAAGALQLFFYWSIMARMVLFMLPPLVFGMAERLEASWKPASLRQLYAASLAATLGLGVLLAQVDWEYAAEQKSFSEQLDRDYLAKGRRVWYSGYMGLEYYLSRAGARGLDALQGGWSQVRPGDAVAVLGINTARVKVGRPIAADVRTWRQDSDIPLRLMSGWTGEGGFYSNLSGFLPYSLSREPLEEFMIVEAK